MKKIYASLLCCLAAVMTSCTVPVEESGSLPRADASSFGTDTSTFSNIFRDMQGSSTSELHSLMVVKDGSVIYEKYDIGHTPDELHILWSATKTFTATAVGFARQDGLLDVTDPVKKFFSEDELPDEDNVWMDQLTVHDLLIMSSGLASDKYNTVTRSGDKSFNPLKTVLFSGFKFEPGTRFSYNSMDSYLLSVIVSKVTGKKLADYLNEKLFIPLGITDFKFDECQLGYNTGGWGLFLTTESLAKMGQFMLQKGEWNGERLLDSSWFDMAMSAQILQKTGLGYTDAELEALRRESDWDAGYCYQMWKCKKGDTVRMDGANGQLVFIMPEKNAVAVLTSHSRDIKALVDSFWVNVYDKL